MLADLAGLDDAALLGIVRSLPRASERRAAACDLLVTRHQRLVRSCVRPYLGGPEPAEDLMQVAYVRLMKAIGNFDPAGGASLATYARPCIGGELKRHFRDKRWQVHVKRPVQELVLQVREATWRLAQELGRTPADSDLTRHLGISGDELRQAQRAEAAFQAYSLDAPLAGQWKIDGWPLVGPDPNANPAAEALGVAEAVAEVVRDTGLPVRLVLAVGPYVGQVTQPQLDLDRGIRVLHPMPTTLLAAVRDVAVGAPALTAEQAGGLLIHLCPDERFATAELLAEGFSALKPAPIEPPAK